MPSRKRVLVFPCGSEIGLELHRALSWSTHFDVVGASSVESNHGKYVFREYVGGLPFVDDTDFIEGMNALVEARRIDFIFPAHDSVVLKLAENAERLRCEVIGSPVATCRICRSKRLTYETLHREVRVPRIYTPGDKDLKFPMFLKPDVGQGSKDTHLVKSLGELSYYAGNQPRLLWLEYLPGREYTVECFTNRDMRLLFVGARERVRTTNGIVTDTYPSRDIRLNEMAETINAKMEFRGAWFFQVKMDSGGEPTLLEVAPRIAGGMGLYRNLGVNLALLSLYDRMGLEVEIVLNRHELEMDRALMSRFSSDIVYDHVYLDLDDTLLFREKVNPLLVAFLYQSINKGKKVHLLTSHVGDLTSALREYRLESVFDSVVQLGKNQSKADCIEEPLSIFIDDSFAERARVHKKRGIPVFGVDAIESLIDWRA